MPAKVHLNDRDLALIHLLQADARIPVSVMARKLGVSRTAVQERLNRLHRDGVIQGFTVRLNPDWQQARIATIVSMVVDPKQGAQVMRALEKIPEVQVLWTVSGRIDLVAIAGAATTAEIDDVLDRIGSLEGVSRTDSSMILSTKFDRRGL